MHVGEKPYVVTTSSSMNAYRGPLAWGQVELSSRVLTPDAVISMVSQILPADLRQSLDDLGAVEHEIVAPAGIPNRFTVVAARGGDDIWLELRRHQLNAPEPVATPELATQMGGTPMEAVAVAVGVEELPVFSDPPASLVGEPTPGGAEEIELVTEVTIEERVPVIDEVGQQVPEHVELMVIPVAPAESPVVASPPQAATEEPGIELVEAEPQGSPSDADVDAMLAATAAALMGSDGASEKQGATFIVVEDEGREEEGEEEEDDAGADDAVDLTAELNDLPPVQEPVQEVVAEQLTAQPEMEPVEPIVVPEFTSSHMPLVAASVQQDEPAVLEEPPQVLAIEQITGVAAVVSAAAGAPEGEVTVEMQPTVATMPRAAAKPDTPPTGAPVTDAGLLEVLKAASERGASIVYVVAQSKPMIRVDGEISALDHGQMMSAPDVERLVAGLAPAALAETARSGPVEWISDVADIGRVRCVTFKDHRGPGLIFRMVSSRSISADHLALSPEVRELCAQTEGLVLITGQRGSGRSTLMAAFVDLINRTRSDHIISVESQIGFTHESRRSFISQREASDERLAAAAVIAAMKEDPDVLIVDEVRAADVAAAVLEAAESGRLVFASVNGSSTTDGVRALLELFPENQRLQARASLAASLRAVVSQMLLRKLAGGRTAARELLFNTPAVATLILEGKNIEIPSALEGGRRHGMMPLTDSLATLVREGTVHAAEAYRKAPDRASLIAALTREGVDTSFAERLA